MNYTLCMITTLTETHIYNKYGISGLYNSNIIYSVPHNHNYFEIHIQVKGSIGHINLIENTKEVFEEGDICLINPNLAHCFEKTSDVNDYINMTISSQRFAEMAEFIQIPAVTMLAKKKFYYLKTTAKKAVIQDIFHEFKQINLANESQETQYCRYKLLTVFILKNFLEICSEPEQVHNYPDWLSDFLLKLTSPDIFLLPLSQIYKLAPYSKSRLCNLFKQYTKQTLQDYIITMKLQYAQKLLINTDLSMLEISNMLNYMNPSHFSSSFKKKYNLTPFLYRANYHENYKQDTNFSE